MCPEICAGDPKCEKLLSGRYESRVMSPSLRPVPHTPTQYTKRGLTTRSSTGSTGFCSEFVTCSLSVAAQTHWPSTFNHDLAAA